MWSLRQPQEFICTGFLFYFIFSGKEDEKEEGRRIRGL